MRDGQGKKSGKILSVGASETVAKASRRVWASLLHWRLRTPPWELAALAALLLLAALINFVGLDKNGYGNTYYATAVKSMLQSPRNFFFGSFDPGGFVTVDKPAPGLWVQTLSAKLFGFSGVSLMLPQAIAGVLSVFMLYLLVRRAFGAPAGLLAGLTLALSPISVVTARDNILDGLLVFTSLLAALAVSRAAETGRLRWLLTGAALVGLGFNIKMLEAFLILPALVLAYLFGAPKPWRIRVAHLALFGVTLAVVALSWSAAVDLTPATDRPYVGSSQTNSELELAFGYNGLQRLFGHHSAPGPTRPSDEEPRTTPTGGYRLALANEPEAQEPKSEESKPAAHDDKGVIGPFRLFQYELGSQVSWLLPLALLALLSSSCELRPRAILRNWRGSHLNARQVAAVLWGTWLLSIGAFFSRAEFFNDYYLAMLAPAICALAAVGLVGLWLDYRKAGWRGWLLPLALVATGIEQVYLLSAYSWWSPWLRITVAGGCFVMTLALVVARIARMVRSPLSPPAALRHIASRWPVRSIPASLLSGALAALICATLLLAPAMWSLVSLRSSNEGGWPLAGPERKGNAPAATPHADARLIQFLQAHARADFLVATRDTGAATPIIFDTGAPVMPMGGFSGYDPILTSDALAKLVREGRVRYFLLPSGLLTTAQLHTLYPESRRIPDRANPNSLLKWVEKRCVPIPPQMWKSSTRDIGTTQLYDCANAAPSSQ